MDPFPFTAEEWEKVREASHAVTNATLADDDILGASHLSELVAVLEELRAKHGDHPILRETEADFQSDPVQQVASYRAALRLAEEHSLRTVSIRLSLARVLLEDFGDSATAGGELLASRAELTRNADDWERKEWARLWRRCHR